MASKTLANNDANDDFVGGKKLNRRVKNGQKDGEK